MIRRECCNQAFHLLTKIVSVTAGNRKMPAQRGQLKPWQKYG